MSRHVLSHELGHTYGILEEGPAWACAGACELRLYGTPYSVMGHGLSDYSVFEKVTFGWIDDVLSPGNGSFELGAIDRRVGVAQAARVVVAGAEYWLEYRPPVPLWPAGDPTATPGLVVYAGPNGVDDQTSRFPSRNLLLLDPAGTGSPSVEPGETFFVPGAFSIHVADAGIDRARLEFRWTDARRPASPRLLAPPARIRSRAVEVSWRPTRDGGSGIGSYELRLDGGPARVVPAARGIGTLLVPVATRLRLTRLALGRHRLAVVAVDRAGNRSAPAVRSFRVVR
jgi:hypothetical protein